MKARFIYPGPGYFLELVFKHDWPPCYKPQEVPRGRSQSQIESAAQMSRQTALKRGHTGTIKSLSSSSTHIKGDASKAQVTKAQQGWKEQGLPA